MGRNDIVAVVGRPNVGKSTFVNRLIGSRKSIVDDQSGVTRDRIYFDVKWLNKSFTVIDTGGILLENSEDEVMSNIINQVSVAVSEADKIIFITDGKEGVTTADKDIANMLRKSNKKIFLVVNKIDSIDHVLMVNEFYSLALDCDPIAISASHGSGSIGDLLDLIVEDIAPDSDSDIQNENTIRLAIVGKPNAGKSSILNAILNKERTIVSDIAGTTRDSIDCNIIKNGMHFVLIDTAGIRKKSKVDFGVEMFAVDRAIRAIRNSDICLLVIDAKKGITDQDKKIAQTIIESAKGMIIAINKWDIIENKDAISTVRFEKEIMSSCPFLNFVPKIFISAKTRQRLDNIFSTAQDVFKEYKKRVSTSLLNKILIESISLNPPKSVKGKTLKVFYATQVADCAPTFVIFINNLNLLQESYRRYIENRFRQSFGFLGVPIRLSFREKKSN